jgi:hypothetical protein
MKGFGSIVMAAVLGLLAALPAAAHGPDPLLGGGLYGQNVVLEYRWAAAGTPPAAMKTAINEGVADANATRRSRAPSFSYDVSATNSVYYGADVPCGIGGLACLRRDPPDWFGVWFRPNGHRFDWGTLRWCELSGSPDGCYEVENVMLDELGHVLVLDHHDNHADESDYLDAVVQTISRTKPRLGWNAHAFGRCDVATLQQQYDMPAWTTTYSTCLDVPTTMGLAASASSVRSGSMVRFTATLKTAGTGKLSNNPVSGRTVVIQQRTSSGWTDVVTMTAGSTAGTYTASITARSSQDYRALFRKPSNEGIRTSGSAAVSITVTSTCTTTICPQSQGGTTK